MKNFFVEKEEQQNIFDRFETVACFALAILVVGIIAPLTYSVEVSQNSVARELPWDFPTDTLGTYIRTDPDTDIEYIIVISDSGSVAVCPREGANDVR